MNDKLVKEIVEKFERERSRYQIFLNGVYDYFKIDPMFNHEPLPLVHSLKSRLKDPSHLAQKLSRKDNSENPITVENVFDRITDLAGIRVLHLHRQQFTDIHKAIESKVKDGDWVYFEAPCAYTWDPETEGFYKSLGIDYKVRDTYYTSVHYIIMPKPNSPIKCEIQVRTLFEEIWGEIDHYINYPLKTKSTACREQLRVLSKLSVTGTRLADSILNSHDEYSKLQDIIAKLQES